MLRATILATNAASENPRQPAARDFSYLEDFQDNSLNKYDKVINLFLNKPTDIDKSMDNVDGMQQYFSDRLTSLAQLLIECFDIPANCWQYMISACSTEILSNNTYRARQFTLDEVLLRLQSARCSVDDRSSPTPKACKSKRRLK